MIMWGNAIVVIKSSVSTEFLRGLHFKYLTFIADRIDMPLQVNPIPFARRLKSPDQRLIDIMVHIREAHSCKYSCI